MFTISTTVKTNVSTIQNFECCIYAKSIHSSLLSWRDRYLKKSNIKAKILKTEGLMKNKIAYTKQTKNTFMPHGCHI